jgi:hypothetical protein
MPLDYRPALYNGTTVFELPQPIYQCKIIDTVKAEQHTVPFKPGGRSYAPTFGSVKITITGGIGVHEGAQTVGDEEQLAVYEELREYLRALTDTGATEFFPFYSSGSYRKFKNVFVESLDIDVGDQSHQEWPWELQLRADDPVIYDSAPGEP